MLLLLVLLLLVLLLLLVYSQILLWLCLDQVLRLQLCGLQASRLLCVCRGVQL